MWRRVFPVHLKRWHTSSRVVALLVLALIVFCNVPAGQSMRLDLKGDPFYLYAFFEYSIERGWPLPFEEVGGTTRTAWDLWKIFSFEADDRWNLAALLLNVIFALCCSYLSGWIFDLRRRRRHRLLQIRILDLIGITLCFALIGAWYAREGGGHQQEQAILASLSDDIRTPYQRYGGPTWLRAIGGDRYLEFLDRAAGIELFDAKPSNIRKLAALPDLEVLIVSALYPAELEEFPRLNQIKVLKLSGVILDSEGNRLRTFMFPAMRNLQALGLSGPHGPIHGLERLPSLQMIKLEECNVNTEMLRALNSISGLRQIYLPEAQVPPNACAQLRSLQHIERFTLTSVTLDDKSLSAIGAWRNLRELDLSDTVLPPNGLRRLRSLHNLTILDLTGKNVTEHDLEPLKDLKQLRILYLREVPISKSRLKLILQLPDCQIVL